MQIDERSQRSGFKGACTFIILLFINVARQAKVAELDAFRRRHQDVSHCYISTAHGQKPKCKTGSEEIVHTK